ncbi:MAG TPA: hypothetical protein PLL28_08700 [Chitinophagales bacterium]|nr:hypothetical protein [Chitinophagales bacterium]
MKSTKIAIIALLAYVGFGFTTIPGGEQQVKVSVGWEFKNLVEGFDHDCKTELYIDGTLVATSSVTKESKANSVSATTSRGKHEIKVINYAFYEGNWEEHTVANNYSIDATYTDNINCKKKNTKIHLIFDIDKGTSVKK